MEINVDVETLDLDSIEDSLRNRDRATLVEIMFNAVRVPAPIKAMAYMSVQSASEDDIADICDKAISLLPAIKAKDGDGLRDALQVFNIPEPFMSLINNALANVSGD